jgi:hypothetical protein
MNAAHRSFALVHGAWHGDARLAEPSASLARARPHRHSTDVTGLGERRPICNDSTDSAGRIDHVVCHIEMEGFWRYYNFGPATLIRLGRINSS